MRWRRWIVALAIPAAGLAASLVYWGQQPPCESFIDGPCENPEAVFGFWWFAYALSAVVLAAVVLALLLRLALLLLSARRKSTDSR